jgi:integrase
VKAWVYQDSKQVKKHGEKKASWFVGWIDPEGKRRCESCGPGSAGKSAAEKVRAKRQAELIEGTYKSNAKKTWKDFREEYEEKILGRMERQTHRLTTEVLDHFERIINPKYMRGIKTQTIDEYIAKRSQEPGKRKGETLSPATLNKDLRHLRAILRRAYKWRYIDRAPDFTFEREPKRLPCYVAPDHFAAIYGACDAARWPDDQPYSAADWWRGLLTMAYMTGWRISELLAVRRDDLDLDAGTAFLAAADTKGERDELTKLHPVVVQHLRKVAGFSPTVFPWTRNPRALYDEFNAIQDTTKIGAPSSRKAHYTFHDLRRGFASMNADRLTADALQALMRHKSYTTTQKYINIARQLDTAVASLHVPDVLNKAMG